MTNAENDKRRSTCSVCGKRLSIKTSSRDITWLPSQVVDEGLYCVECFKKKGAENPTRKNRT